MIRSIALAIAELLICLEMMRDSRTHHQEEETSKPVIKQESLIGAFVLDQSSSARVKVTGVKSMNRAEAKASLLDIDFDLDAYLAAGGSLLDLALMPSIAEKSA